MNIDLNVYLENFNGGFLISESMTGDDGTTIKKNATLKDILIDSLLANLDSDKNKNYVTKIKRYELAKEIFRADIIDLSFHNIEILKNRVSERYENPMIIGEVARIIEGLEE